MATRCSRPSCALRRSVCDIRTLRSYEVLKADPLSRSVLRLARAEAQTLGPKTAPEHRVGGCREQAFANASRRGTMWTEREAR